MDLKGQTVIHNVFGEGIIIDHGDKYLTISFQQENKKFQYPDAFKSFLKVKDPSVDNAIHQELNAIDEGKNHIQKEQAEKNRQAQQSASPQTIAPKIRIITTKSPNRIKAKKEIARYNVAFKCNYCDGGKSPEQIGFNGICSDAIIHNNIAIEHRSWCSDPDCACREYFDGEITRFELEKTMGDNDFICYESQMLREWRAFAGFVLIGKDKGKPNRLLHVQRYSLCVLTTRDPGVEEHNRYIFAVFLVDDSYEGDKREEGYVTTSSDYKIKLSPDEAHTMLYWKYHANGNNPTNPAWMQGLHRYLGDEEAALILRDIVSLKRGTKDEALAIKFYEYGSIPDSV